MNTGRKAVIIIILLFAWVSGCSQKAPQNTDPPCPVFSPGPQYDFSNRTAVSIAYSPDGRYIAAGGRDGHITVWNRENGEVVFSLKAHQKAIHSLAFSHDNRFLASGSADKTVKVRDVPTGDEKGVLSGSLFEVFSVAFSPDGKYLASGAGDDFVRIWDFIEMKEIKILRGHIYAIHTIAFSPDGRLLGVGCYDDTISIWDAQTLKRIHILTQHMDQAWSVCFSPNSRLFAAGCEEGGIFIWNVEKEGFPLECSIPEGPQGQVTYVRFVSNNLLASIGNADGFIYFRSIPSGRQVTKLKACDPIAECMEVSPDKNEISVGTRDGRILTWKIEHPPE